MKDNLIFSLDIGTSTIIGIIGQYINENEFRILEFSIRKHNKRNMYDGQIHDIEGVTKIVKEIVEDLEEKIGEKLEFVSIAAAGRALKTNRIKVNKSFDEPREISKQDIEAIELEAIQKSEDEINLEEENLNARYYCIGHTVIEYLLDNNKLAKLEGHKGQDLSVDMVTTFLPHMVVDSLYTVMERSGLQVASLTLEPIAAIKLAIKEELRLLNLALVDIGAGTSDIAITKEGQIFSYAMTSTAGDEITESLSKKYLLDFNSSEALKVELNKKDEHEFSDIVGVKYNLTSNEILESIKDIVEKISEEIAEKILEYNGDAPNAVFLIGGSSQMPMLKEHLANMLGLPLERVSVRDLSTIDNISGIDELEKGPDMITPISIALESAEGRYKNFIKVYFEENEYLLFNGGDVKVSDLLALAKYDPENLLPKRSDDFVYYINRKKRIRKGNIGSYPQILINGEEASLKSKLRKDSHVEIIGSEVEATSVPRLHEIIYLEKFIYLNNNKINLIKKIVVNGKETSENIYLKSGSNIEITQIRTIEELLYEYSLPINYGKTLINNQVSYPDYILKENDNIMTLESNNMVALENDHRIIIENDDRVALGNDNMVDLENKELVIPEIKRSKVMNININGENKTLDHENDRFLLVDVFDFLDFDLNSKQGRLVLKVNGNNAGYMTEVKDGDELIINWQ